MNRTQYFINFVKLFFVKVFFVIKQISRNYHFYWNWLKSQIVWIKWEKLSLKLFIVFKKFVYFFCDNLNILLLWLTFESANVAHVNCLCISLHIMWITCWCFLTHECPNALNIFIGSFIESPLGIPSRCWSNGSKWNWIGLCVVIFGRKGAQGYVIEHRNVMLGRLTFAGTKFEMIDWLSSLCRDSEQAWQFLASQCTQSD